MMVFVVIALWTFFGRIFRSTQPWFSLLLGGAGLLWTISYSRHLFLEAMGRNILCSGSRKYYYNQIVIAVTIILVAIGIAIYDGPNLRWIALASLAVGVLIGWPNTDSM